MTTLQKVNEKSSAYLTVEFFDKEGLAVVPTSVYYTVHDKITGTVLKERTAVTGAAIIEIELTPAMNVICNSKLQFEMHVVTIEGLNNVSGINDEYLYYVKNLHYYP